MRRFGPELRQAADYDTLLEMNTCGETVAVEFAPYASEAPRLLTGSVSGCRSSLLLALARNHRIGHIPYPLVSRDGGSTVDPAAAAAHEEAVRAHVAAASLAKRFRSAGTAARCRACRSSGRRATRIRRSPSSSRPGTTARM